MDIAALQQLIIADPLVDVAARRRELEHIRRGRGVLDAREVHVLGRLDQLTASLPSVFPEAELATASRSSLGKASKVRDRQAACDQLPELADALAEGSTTGERVDAGLGRFGLPVETVRRWACIGSVTPVVVGAEGVRLFLGRETRLASRDQRRALRVLYRTCALCDVPFEHTQMHHVSWFGRHGGATDIGNLLPLCNRHHHLVHEGGWQLVLHPDRRLTVTMPDGRVLSHAPPRVRAA